MGLLFDVSSCRLCVPDTDLLDFEDHVRKLVKVCERVIKIGPAILG